MATGSQSLREENDAKARATAAFLRELKSAVKHFRWYLDDFGQIRGEAIESKYPFCPITAVAFVGTGTIYRANQVHEAAETLGLSRVSTMIVDAIDNRNGTELRFDLLRIVGIKD